MRERQAITKEMARRYVRASKRERRLMLDELCALAGYNRSYAARLLREKVRGAPPRERRRRGRGPVYGAELIAPLTKVWATLGVELELPLPQTVPVWQCQPRRSATDRQPCLARPPAGWRNRVLGHGSLRGVVEASPVAPSLNMSTHCPRDTTTVRRRTQRVL